MTDLLSMTIRAGRLLHLDANCRDREDTYIRDDFPGYIRLEIHICRRSYMRRPAAKADEHSLGVRQVIAQSMRAVLDIAGIDLQLLSSQVVVERRNR